MSRVLVLALVLSVASASTALALVSNSMTLCNPFGDPPCSTTGGCQDLGCIVHKVLVYLLNIAIPTASIMVLYGGFQMMTAVGDPTKFSKGKKTLVYAALGLAIVLLAKAAAPELQKLFG